MEVRLSDIQIAPIMESVFREKISDEVYFSPKYSGYISNSRLKLINPDQGGCPSLYQKGFSNNKTQSLYLGSKIHELCLQPEEFSIGPDYGKPNGKLGLVIDEIIKLRKQHWKVHEAILEACKRVDYYQGYMTPTRIKSIVKSGYKYYLQAYHHSNESECLLSTKDRKIVTTCVENLKSKEVQNVLYPTDLFGDAITFYNEDAFFIDFACKHEDKECVIKFKMKADNWTIDLDNKVITLNDLKTTGHLANQFMEGSWINFHYSRQFSLYLYVLLRYCEKEYGYNSDEWTFKCNVVVVETTGDNRACVFPITKEMLEPGRKEFCKLLKMVAYCEMYGYSDDINFI